MKHGGLPQKVLPEKHPGSILATAIRDVAYAFDGAGSIRHLPDCVSVRFQEAKDETLAFLSYGSDILFFRVELAIADYPDVQRRNAELVANLSDSEALHILAVRSHFVAKHQYPIYLAVP